MRGAVVSNKKKGWLNTTLHNLHNIDQQNNLLTKQLNKKITILVKVRAIAKTSTNFNLAIS